MKASELIKELELAIEKHGDLNVWVAHEWVDSVDGIEPTLLSLPKPDISGIWLAMGKKSY